MWVSFNDRLPSEGKHIITMRPSSKGYGHLIDSYPEWNSSMIEKIRTTYWWDGDQDIEKAVGQWYRRKEIVKT